MQISSVSSQSYQPADVSDSFEKAKKAFETLGSALDSGSLTDAKQALAQLQKNAPAQAGNSNNPISAKIETLGKALDSGDLSAAKTAYADIQKTLSQRPTGGGGRPSGPPPSGANSSSNAVATSSSNKTYDVKDTNKDGNVSYQEEAAYIVTHPDAAKTTSTTANIDSDKGKLDITA